MNKNIETLSNELSAMESNLWQYVEELDKHMDECDCDEQEEHSFVNTLGHNELHVFCLNCGGYIDSNDLEDF
jgi:hypothetical protein